MPGFDVYLLQDGFQIPGLIAGQEGELATEIFNRYQDQEVREREGILSCWITMEGGEVPILGKGPQGWSRNCPVHENR
jgi:hypothetical protein